MYTFSGTVPKIECPNPIICIFAVLRSSPFLCCCRKMSQQMGDSHRRFLQTMMGCAVLTGREAESLLRYCCEAHNSESFKICFCSLTLHYIRHIKNLNDLSKHPHSGRCFYFYRLINVLYGCFETLRWPKWMNTIHLVMMTRYLF